MQYVDLGPLLLVVVTFVALACVVGVTAGRTRGGASGVRSGVVVLLVGSVVAVLTVTLGGVASTPGLLKEAGATVNLAPFRDIKTVLQGGNGQLILLNIVGNVVMFVPVGLLLGLLLRRPIVSVGLTWLLSIAIELIQFAAQRAADIDDVMLNGVGAVIGVFFAFAVLRAFPWLV